MLIIIYYRLHFFCIFHTSLVFIFSSCKSDYNKVSPLLTQAEEVLQSYPDSAYLLLQQVDTVSLTPVQRAHYCYLFTAASDKLGHTITWPDAMRQAAEIYAPVAKDNDTKARLYYYAGMANQRNHRDSVAVACFYRSLDYQDESIPTRLLVFTYEGLYLSYYNQNYFTEACEFIEKTVVLCKKTQNKIGEVWALHQYAHTLMCIKEREKGVEVLEELRSTAEQYNLPYAGAYYSSYSSLYRIMGDYEKALAYNDTALLRRSANSNVYAFYYARANILKSMNNADSAFVYYMKALDGDDIERKRDIYSFLIEISPYTDLDNYLEKSFADSLSHYTHLKEKMVKPQEIATIEKNWRQKKIQEESNRKNIRIFVLATLFMTIAVNVYFYIRRKHRRQLSSLHQFKEAKLQELAHTNEKIEKINSSEFNHFKSEVWTPEMNAFLLSDSFRNLNAITTIEPGEKLPQAKQIELITNINVAFSNTMIFINQISEVKISSDELFFLIVTYLDIKPRYIAKCFNCTAESLQKKKQRLKKKLPPLYSSHFFTSVK